MSLIIGLGSNIGNPFLQLENAKNNLVKQNLKLIAASRIYQSKAVDYEAQPDFYNQVIEFQIPNLEPLDVMKLLLKIENDMGRVRDILRGPRTIDLDLLFFGEKIINSPDLILPHPRIANRSFVIRPLLELPFGKILDNKFNFKKEFIVDAYPT